MSDRRNRRRDDDEIDEEERERREILEEERKAKQREIELREMKAVLDLPDGSGKRVLFRLIWECGAFETVFDPSSRMSYLAGKQDVGHYLMTEIGEAAPQALGQMIQDAYLRKAKEKIEKEREA